MSGDGSYAPKSPDLSSFFASPAPAPGPTSAQAPASLASGPAQAQAQASARARVTGPTLQHQNLQSPTRQQRDLPQQSLHLQPPAPSPYYLASSPGHQHQVQPSPSQPHHGQQTPTSYTPQTPTYYTPPSQVPRHLSQPAIPAYGVPPAQGPQYYPTSYSEPRHPLSPQPQPQTYPLAQGPLYTPSSTLPQTPSQSEPQASLDNMPGTRRSAQAAAPKPAVDPSPVKTKFPTARIKRIMQADEDVGKVAQQTPIAVGKALEMFMVALVTKSADVAREKSSKRVTAQMLKQVVETDEQWDFLRELVGKVDNEEKAGKATKVKPESDSEEEEVEVKKKAKAGRKKKV